MSTVIGVILGCLFDIFKLARVAYKKNKHIVIFDIAFSCLALYFVFYALMGMNNGILRLYEFIAMALGFMIYYYLCRKVFIAIIIFIIRLLYKISKTILISIIFIYKPLKPVWQKYKKNKIKLRNFARKI